VHQQSLPGIIRSIRFIRTTLAIVALVLVLLFLALIVVIFCPLDPIPKYVLIAVVIILGIGVWLSFWRKAKKEPLTLSETYWIATLPYIYGSKQKERTREEENLLPKETATPEVSPPPEPTKLQLEMRD
jgi:hypothetical protein